MNIWRFAHAGRVCSGDYLDYPKKDADENIYLIVEGRFLKIILILVYTIFALAALTIMITAGILYR